MNFKTAEEFDVTLTIRTMKCSDKNMKHSETLTLRKIQMNYSQNRNMKHSETLTLRNVQIRNKIHSDTLTFKNAQKICPSGKMKWHILRWKKNRSETLTLRKLNSNGNINIQKKLSLSENRKSKICY